jgi:hypothetical protein
MACFVAAGKNKQQHFLDLFKKYPDESYRPTAETVDGILANVTNHQFGPGFTTYDVRDLAGLSHTEHPQPYLLTVRTHPAQVIRDIVRNCYTIDGVQTFAKFAKEVVDARGVRYISEPWTGNLWLDTQVSSNGPRAGCVRMSALLTPARLQGAAAPTNNGTAWQKASGCSCLTRLTRPTCPWRHR